MKKPLLLLLIICPLSFIYAQDTLAKASADTNKEYTFVQQKPMFNGDLYKYIADHVVYPKDAIDKNITGTVYMSFVIEKDGSVTGVKVLKGVYPSIDNEAVNVIQKLPKWNPNTEREDCTSAV